MKFPYILSLLCILSFALISQASGAELTLSPSGESVGPNGGTYTFNVNESHTIFEDGYWSWGFENRSGDWSDGVVRSPEEPTQRGNQTFSYFVPPNRSTSSRTQEIRVDKTGNNTFGGEGARTRHFTIEQGGSPPTDLNDLTYTLLDGEVTIVDCDEAASGALVIPATIGGYPVTRIWASAFRNCSSLTNVTIPDSVTGIGANAFSDCTSLTRVIMQGSPPSIGNFPFRSPVTIYVPVGVPGWGTQFSGRPVLRGLPLNVAFNSDRGQVNRVPNLPSYEQGTVVTLTATPAEGYLFTSWAGDGSGLANPLQVTMDATKAINAVFSTDEGDNDSDGLTNYQEIITYQTDPDLRDSNADGVEDGRAVELGYSPTFNFQNLLGFLESNPGTIFPNLYTQAQLDAERTAGQEDVTNSPETYALLTQAAHDAAIAVKTAQIATLEGEKAALAGQVTTLTETVAARDASILTLEGEKTALAGQVTTLTETVAARNATILTLEGEKTALAGQLDTLQNGRTGQVNGYDIGPNVDLSEADIGSPIAAGVFHSLAIKTDGAVVAWGRNFAGETDVPEDLNNVISVGRGVFHSLAVKNDGTVVAWGRNNEGQITVPEGLSDVLAVSGGYYHSLALKEDGTVVAWGGNDDGQTDIPTGLNGVVAIAAGDYHNLALKADGTVVAWGRNNDGQITVPEGLNDVRTVQAGAYFSLALKSDGTVVAWGRNNVGQITVPEGLSDVGAISAGNYHSLALKDDGTVVAWGRNTEGQATVPGGLSDVVAVAAGYQHSVALKGDGTLVVWGDNRYGQGDIPVGLSGAVTVSGTAADLSRADLSSYNLSGANLTGVNFSGTNLDGTNFSNADLSGADLSGASGIDSANFTDATLDGIVLPQGYSVSSGYVVGGERPVPWSFVQVQLTPLENQVAELSQRPTLAEVQDARVGSIVLAKDDQSDEVSLCFGLQKTDDFVSWTAFEGGTWSDAPNGEFKLTLPLGEAKKWLRLTLPE